MAYFKWLLPSCMSHSDPGSGYLERGPWATPWNADGNTTSPGAGVDEFLFQSLTIVDNFPVALDGAGDCDKAGVLSGLDVGAGRTTQSAGRLRTRAR